MNLRHIMLDDGGLAHKKNKSEFYSHHNPQEGNAEPESRLVAARGSKKRVGTEKTFMGYSVVLGFWSAETQTVVMAAQSINVNH